MRKNTIPFTQDNFDVLMLAIENLGQRISEEASRRDADNKAQAAFNDAVLRLINGKSSKYEGDE